MIPWRGLRDEWVMLGLTLLTALAALAHGRPSAGEPLVVELGVVPLDATQLACVGAGCAFDSNQQPTGVQLPLRPFVTIGSQLIVMSGVFESPKVKAWLETSPQKGVKLRCPAVLLSRSTLIALRFRTADAFVNHEVPVLSASECEVVP